MPPKRKPNTTEAYTLQGKYKNQGRGGGEKARKKNVKNYQVGQPKITGKRKNTTQSNQPPQQVQKINLVPINQTLWD